jgi:hypothetical protein
MFPTLSRSAGGAIEDNAVAGRGCAIKVRRLPANPEKNLTECRGYDVPSAHSSLTAKPDNRADPPSADG